MSDLHTRDNYVLAITESLHAIEHLEPRCPLVAQYLLFRLLAAMSGGCNTAFG